MKTASGTFHQQNNCKYSCTHLADDAVIFVRLIIPNPRHNCWSRKVWCHAQALALAEQKVIIPMVGMVHSLNVFSGSCFLILYEGGSASAQRQQGCLYNTCQLTDDSEPGYCF